MDRSRGPRSTTTLSLASRASEDLRQIRATMERAASFTALPGWGGVLMGVVALGAAPLAAATSDRVAWLELWLTAALVAFVVGGTDMLRKVRAQRASLLSAPASRFFLTLIPAFFTGACLTLVLARAGEWQLLPGTWLLAYGSAVFAASVHTIRGVRWMGAAFLALGAFSLLFPDGRGDVWMALGFGGVHIVYGAWIARREMQGVQHG
ncbi:MAG: hypothetical protein IPJ19_16630 [Planctomycetes bacterium]|nr:hypothetical protein [Planctomycetota bacterium]